MEKFTCPVCGYDNLDSPPYDDYDIPSFDICLCCGCEFGYNDATPAAKKISKSLGSKWDFLGAVQKKDQKIGM
jgi:rubredoxin